MTIVRYCYSCVNNRIFIWRFVAYDDLQNSLIRYWSPPVDSLILPRNNFTIRGTPRPLVLK